MQVYRIEVEQHNVGDGLYKRETLDVQATSAQIALSRAMKMARGNGFLKSYPIEVVSLERIVRELK